MQYGWSAPFIVVLKKPDSPVKITDSDVIWLEIIYILGAFIGLPITIFLVDRIGRKNCLIIAALNSLTAWILTAVANRIEYLFVARILTGLAGDVAFVAAPMYVAEIADQKIRGFLSGVISLMMLIGILFIYALTPFVPIYVTSIVGGAILVFELVTFPFMPDSPYYLMSKDKYEQAKHALKRLRGNENVDEEIEKIAKAVKRQKSERGHVQDMVLVKSNRKALNIMLMLNSAQHMSGMSVLLMNLHVILEAAGSIYIESTTAAIIFAVLMLMSATVTDLIMDKTGRKILLIISSLLTTVSIYVLAIYFNLKNLDYNVINFSWIPIVSIMAYAVVFKLGLGTIPIVLTAELFPANVKAMGMAFSDAMYVLASLISIELYQWLSEFYGLHVPFYVFATYSLITTIFCLCYIPETKRRSLEEIQYILKGEPIPTDLKEQKNVEAIDNELDSKL